MSQSLINLQNTVESFNKDLLSHNKCSVQKIMSSAHYLCLRCRFPGKTLYLYLGRGARFQGCALSSRALPPYLRIKDRYLDYARKYWRSITIKKLAVSKIDRVLNIEGYSSYGMNKIYFFWRGRDLFFAHAYIQDGKGRLYRSWEKSLMIDQIAYNSINEKMLFSSLGFGQHVRTRGEIDIEGYLSDQDKVGEKKASVKRLKRKNDSLVKKLEVELKKIDDALAIIKFVDSDLTNSKEVGEGRFKVRFYDLEGHYKKRDLLFKKIKQWRSSKKIVEERLERASQKSHADLNNEAKKASSPVKIISPIWKTEEAASEIIVSTNYISFIFKKYQCFLGRTSLENDFIRTKLSRKSDLWVHLENMKSGHLFIRNGVPSLEDFSVLASALVDLCGLVMSEIPIIYTEVANIKGLKGARGSVTFKKEKRLTLYYDQDWRRQVLSVDEISEL